MFAMFHLGRPDVFPLGDLAVRKGLQELYDLKVMYIPQFYVRWYHHGYSRHHDGVPEGMAGTCGKAKSQDHARM